MANINFDREWWNIVSHGSARFKWRYKVITALNQRKAEGSDSEIDPKHNRAAEEGTRGKVWWNDIFLFGGTIQVEKWEREGRNKEYGAGVSGGVRIQIENSGITWNTWRNIWLMNILYFKFILIHYHTSQSASSFPAKKSLNSITSLPSLIAFNLPTPMILSKFIFYFFYFNHSSIYFLLPSDNKGFNFRHFSMYTRIMSFSCSLTFSNGSSFYASKSEFFKLKFGVKIWAAFMIKPLWQWSISDYPYSHR